MGENLIPGLLPKNSSWKMPSFTSTQTRHQTRKSLSGIRRQIASFLRGTPSTLSEPTLTVSMATMMTMKRYWLTLSMAPTQNWAVTNPSTPRLLRFFFPMGVFPVLLLKGTEPTKQGKRVWFCFLFFFLALCDLEGKLDGFIPMVNARNACQLKIIHAFLEWKDINRNF